MVVAHVCNTSDWGVAHQEGSSLKPDPNKQFMRTYLKNPITEMDWDSVSRSENICLASVRTWVQNNYKKSKQNKVRKPEKKKKNHFNWTRRQTSGGSGWEPIQRNSLHNSISKVPTKTTWCSIWRIRELAEEAPGLDFKPQSHREKKNCFSVKWMHPLQIKRETDILCLYL
jgi:hypothetical protein